MRPELCVVVRRVAPGSGCIEKEIQELLHIIDRFTLNPHIHAIVTRGVFLANGQWHPIPYVDTHKAELAFRHKLLRLLRDRDLISERNMSTTLRHSQAAFSEPRLWWGDS